MTTRHHYTTRLAAIDNVRRGYFASDDPARPYSYRCPTCRHSKTPGMVTRYRDRQPVQDPCTTCASERPTWPGRLYVAHPAAVPVDKSYAGNFGKRNRRGERYGSDDPTPRRAWEGGERDTFIIFDTGETWRPVVWRLPNRRGFLPGFLEEHSGSVCMDTARYAFDGDYGDPNDTEPPADVIREACSMAERAAREADEDQQRCDYAREEGHKAGRAGKGPDANDERDCYAEVWEEARAEGYADGAREDGEEDGRNGDPCDASAWPLDADSYRKGWQEGREALHAAARRAGMDYAEEVAP